MMTKKIHLYGKVFVTNRNFTTEHEDNVQILCLLFKIPVFFFRLFSKFSQIPGFLCLNCQIPNNLQPCL